MGAVSGVDHDNNEIVESTDLQRTRVIRFVADVSPCDSDPVVPSTESTSAPDG